MSRKLIVEIIGDTSSLDKSLKTSTKGAQSFGVSMKGLAKGALLAGGAAGVASKGVDLLFEGLGKSITAAEEAEKAHALVAQSFKNAGLSADKYSKQIDAVGKAAVQLGFDDEDAQVSMAKFVTAGQSVGQAMRDVAIAEDLARAKNIDLDSSTKIITGALAGQTRALKTLGIAYIPTTKAVDELRAAHAASKEPITAVELATAKLADKQANAAAVLERVSAATKGQAEAFSQTAAGGMAQFQVQVQNIEEAIGGKLLPVMTQTVAFINDNWSTIGTVIAEVFAVAKIAIENFIAPMRVLWALLHGDWAGAWNALKAPAVAAFDAIKGAIMPVINLISGGLTSALQAIRNTFANVWSAIQGVVSSAVGSVRGSLSSLASFVEGRASNVWGGLKGAVSGALSGLGSIASNAFNGFVNAIERAAGAAGRAARRVGEAVVDAIRSVIDAIKVPGAHIDVPYPSVHLTYSSIDTHIPGVGTVSIPTGASISIGHTGFDTPTLDPFGSFAAGGQIPGAGGPVPIMAHAGEFVIRKSAVDALGSGFLSSLNSFQTGGLLDPTDSSGHTLPLTSAVGSGIPYEIWRRKVAMSKYAKKEARIMASRALYNPSMLPTPASRADMVIDDWMTSLSTDALFTERLGALKAFVDSGDAYRGGAVSRSWLTYGVPKLATGGNITRSGIAYVHRGETVTPAGASPVIHVYVGEKEVAAIVRDSIVEDGRKGGPLAARTP